MGENAKPTPGEMPGPNQCKIIAMPTNWRTTTSGIVGAIGAVGLVVAFYIQSNPRQFSKYPWLLPLAGILLALGNAGNGRFAKDANTHSTAAEVSAATVEKQQEGQPAGTTMTVAAQTVTESTKP